MIDYEYWLLYCKLRDFVNTSPRTTDLQKKCLLETIKWLNKYISLIDNKDFIHHEPLKELKRGDVVLVDLGENIGMEFSGKHPAVILRDGKIEIDQIFCLPLTTKRPKGYNPNKQGIFLEINRIQGLKGYQHPSNPNNVNNWKHWCNILNIRNISKRRIYSPPAPCKMDGSDLTAISSAIKNQIAI